MTIPLLITCMLQKLLTAVFLYFDQKQTKIVQNP
jgi:hypothetical protein